MNITVLSIPKSKRPGVKKVDPLTYYVRVSEPAIQGRSNHAIIESLSEYFGIPQFDIIILSGHTGQVKTIQVPLSLEKLKRHDSTPIQESLFNY